MQCKKCGKELMDNATFCTSCGWKTDEWHKAVTESKTIHKATSSALIIGILAVLLLLISFLKAI